MNPCQDPTYLSMILVIKEIVKIICIAAPILLILILSIKLAKLVINGGKDESSEIRQMVAKIISAMCIFFVPMFVNISLSLVDEAGVDEGECWINANSVAVAKYRAMADLQEEERKAEKALKLAKIAEENQRKEEVKKEQWKQAKEKFKNWTSVGSGQGSGGLGDCKGLYKGTKYNLTEDEIVKLARIVNREYSADEVGAKAVASHMANLYEIRQYLGYGKGQSLFTYITTCGWYGSAAFNSRTMSKSQYDSEISKNAVREVIVNGNRTLPLYIDEYDMFPNDINGASSIDDYKNYTPGVTRLYNVYGATGIYYCTTSAGWGANIFFYTSNGESYKKKMGY